MIPPSCPLCGDLLERPIYDDVEWIWLCDFCGLEFEEWEIENQ